MLAKLHLPSCVIENVDNQNIVDLNEWMNESAMI